jgi:hypothetical protein
MELLDSGHSGNKVLVPSCWALGTTGRENRETGIGDLSRIRKVHNELVWRAVDRAVKLIMNGNQ